MDKYKQQQESDFSWRRAVDEGRRTKMRKEKEKTDNDDNGRSGTNSNSTSSSLRKQPQPHGGIGGGGSRGRSPWPGIDPLTDRNLLYKTSARAPNLPPRRSVNEKKVVNWRLACYMSNEYLTRGTLLGRPWPPQDSKPNWHENNDKSEPNSGPLDEDGDESRRDKERLYHTLADFLRAGDVHLPGIVNPSQLAAWLGLK